MIQIKALLILLPILAFTACSAIDLPESTTIPTQQIWQISYSSELAWMKDEFDSCINSHWNVGLVVEQTGNIEFSNQQADAILSWGDVDPQGLNAFQIGTDNLEVIVNPQLDLDEISVDKLLSIYQGVTKDWSEVDTDLQGEIHGWIYPETVIPTQVFTQNLGGLEIFSSSLNIAPDVSAMIEAVSKDSQAIGFIPASWKENGMKSLIVDEWENIDIPIVALINRSDDEKLTAWLSCLTDQLSKLQ